MAETGIDLPALAITLVIVSVVLFVGINVFGTIESVENTQEITRIENESVQLDGLETVQIRDTRGTDPVVRNSLGNALAFSAADNSTAQTTNPIDVSDPNWTVSQPVWIEDANRNQTFFAIGDPDLIVRYVGNSSTPVFQAVYYQSAGLDTHNITVNATDVQNVSFVRVSNENGTLSIWDGNTKGETANVSTDGSFGGNLTGNQTLTGKLDETRVFNANLTVSEWNAIQTNPVLPAPESVQDNRSARIMYDKQGGLIDVFFASASLQHTNTQIATGFSGAIMDEKTGMLDVTGGNDYRWDIDGPKITPIDGGRLDGAPVLFASYDWNTNRAMDQLLNDIANAYELAGMLPIVLVLAGVVGLLLTLRGRR